MYIANRFFVVAVVGGSVFYFRNLPLQTILTATEAYQQSGQ